MKYDEQSDNYIGETPDAVGRMSKGYLIDGDIHIIYYQGTKDEWITTKPYKDVVNNEDKFLFTPFVIFSSMVKAKRNEL